MILIKTVGQRSSAWMNNTRCARVNLMSWMKSLRRLCYKPRASDIVISVWPISSAGLLVIFSQLSRDPLMMLWSETARAPCIQCINKGSGVRSHICNFVAPERALFLCILSAAKVSSCLSHTFAHPFSVQHSRSPGTVVVGQFANLLWDAFLWIAVQTIWQITRSLKYISWHLSRQTAFIDGFES